MRHGGGVLFGFSLTWLLHSMHSEQAAHVLQTVAAVGTSPRPDTEKLITRRGRTSSLLCSADSSEERCQYGSEMMPHVKPNSTEVVEDELGDYVFVLTLKSQQISRCGNQESTESRQAYIC